MSDKNFSCFDKMKKYILLCTLFIVVFNVTALVVMYYKLNAKIYHTYFMNRETLEKIYNIDISLNSSTGHIQIEKK